MIEFILTQLLTNFSYKKTPGEIRLFFAAQYEPIAEKNAVKFDHISHDWCCGRAKRILYTFTFAFAPP